MEDHKTWSGMLRKEHLARKPETEVAITGGMMEIRTDRDYNPTHEALLRYAEATKMKSKLTIRKAGMLTETERAEKRGRLLIFAGRKLANS